MRKRGMKPEDLTRLWSTHAAKLAGMQHRKGALAAGMDADIVVWHPPALPGPVLPSGAPLTCAPCLVSYRAVLKYMGISPFW